MALNYKSSTPRPQDIPLPWAGYRGLCQDLVKWWDSTECCAPQAAGCGAVAGRLQPVGRVQVAVGCGETGAWTPGGYGHGRMWPVVLLPWLCGSAASPAWHKSALAATRSPLGCRVRGTWRCRARGQAAICPPLSSSGPNRHRPLGEDQMCS